MENNLVMDAIRIHINGDGYENFAKRIHITKNKKAYTNQLTIEAQIKKLHQAYLDKFSKNTRLTKLVIVMEYYDIQNIDDLKELEYGFETI